MTAVMNALAGRGVSAALSGISTLTRRMESAVDRARKDDGGFGAQAAMISGGLIAIAVVITLVMRDRGSDAVDVLDGYVLTTVNLTTNA